MEIGHLSVIGGKTPSQAGRALALFSTAMLTSFAGGRDDHPIWRFSILSLARLPGRQPFTPSEEKPSFHRTHYKDRGDVHSLDRLMPTTETHPACTTPLVGMWLSVLWMNGHVRGNLTKTVTHRVIYSRALLVCWLVA